MFLNISNIKMLNFEEKRFSYFTTKDVTLSLVPWNLAPV